MARSLLQRDRAIVLAVLLVAAAVAWIYLLTGAGMRPVGSGAMLRMAPDWTPGYALLMFLMWASMMLAMMLPAAAPAMLLVAALVRESGGSVLRQLGLFSSGYLIVWLGFSLCATLAQWGLGRIGWLSAGMASHNAMFSGWLLIAAGLYQWTRFKRACLDGCRSPLEKLTRFWRRGWAAPWLAGVAHGAYCLGCCWLLMLLVFVGGVMNLAWVALLAVMVFAEKALPFGAAVRRWTGACLLLAGVVVQFPWQSLAMP